MQRIKMVGINYRYQRVVRFKSAKSRPDDARPRSRLAQELSPAQKPRGTAKPSRMSWSTAGSRLGSHLERHPDDDPVRISAHLIASRVMISFVARSVNSVV